MAARWLAAEWSRSGMFVGVLESGAALLPGCVPGLGFAPGLNPRVLIPLLHAGSAGCCLARQGSGAGVRSSHFLHLGRGLGRGFWFFFLVEAFRL